MPMNRSHPPDLRYSDWHRRLAPTLGMIDLDAVECCHRCWAPLALIELTRWGSGEKRATTTTRLADAAGVPAYLVRYEFPEPPPPTRLSVRKLGDNHPARLMTAGQYEEFLHDLRFGHQCDERTQPDGEQ
jgi:hypothetical protein